MASEHPAQWDGRSLVEKHSHAATPHAGAESGDGETALGVFQHGFDLVTGHAREPFEKVVDPCAMLEVLEQRAHRNPRTPKQPDAAHLSRHALNRATVVPPEHGFRVRPSILGSKARRAGTLRGAAPEGIRSDLVDRKVAGDPEEAGGREVTVEREGMAPRTAKAALLEELG